MIEERESTPPPRPAPTRRRGRKGGLCAAGLLAALAGLAAPLLTPLWLAFDAFSHFTIHFAILAVACAAGLLTRAGPKLAVPLALAGAVALALWARGQESGGFSAPSAPGHVRVMTFNTWKHNHDIAAIAAEIRRQKPDIVGMMEFGHNKPQLFSMLKGELPYSANCVNIPYCFLGFMSRWPIEKVTARSLWLGPPYLHAIVRTPQGPLHVFVVHTLRFPWMGSQMKQVRAMARLVRHARGPKVVMGDFNSTIFSAVLRTFGERSRLRLLTGLPSWPAWLAGLPQLGIDHIFASPRLRRISGPFLGASSGSDHFPVIVELGFDGGKRQPAN